MKFLKLLIFLFVFLFFNNCVKSQNQPPITLIINPNINNTYVVGSKCGDETLTCNSIGDAVAYFKSIAVLEDNGTIYQQLNIKLSNGTYGIKENSVNLFQYNCKISPLDKNGDIVFNGLINALESSETMFNITGSINNTSTSISISGVNFINFKHGIIQVLGENQNANLLIDNCSFYDGVLPKSIDIIGFTLKKTGEYTPIGTITISNSLFNKYTYNNDQKNFRYLIYTSGVTIKLNNVIISDINSYMNVIEILQSNASLINCNLANVKTYDGAIRSDDGNVEMENSTFSSLSSIISSTVLFYSARETTSFKMTNCKVVNCNSELGASGLKFSAFDLPISPKAFISNCIFNNNNASKGSGVIDSYKLQITVNDCSFNSNVALMGGIFNIQGSSLTVTNSILNNFIDQSNIETEIRRSAIGTFNTSILFNGCTFGKDYFTIDCYRSTIKIDNSSNLNPFFTCSACNSLTVDSQTICQDSSTTSTYMNDSLQLIPNHYYYSIGVFILIAKTIISTFIY
ncbi:hypothetical protein ACTA71_007815 [Dictyostelium dimigraforme]